MTKRERVAVAIYGAAFMPESEAQAKRQIPSPGWCWAQSSEYQKAFCLRQADAAIAEIETPNK